MEELRQEVNTFRVSKVCECGGMMQFTGIQHTMNPPEYVHRCTGCEFGWAFKKIYPCIEHEVKE